MKIIQVTPVFMPYHSGMTNVVYEQTKELSRRGRTVHVLTPRYDVGLMPEEAENGFTVNRIKPWLQHGNGGFVPGLAKIIKQLTLHDNSIVHLHTPFYGGQEIIWWLKLINKLKAQLVVQYHHDPQLKLKAKLFSLPSKFIFKRLLKQADKIIVSSVDYARHSRIRKFIGQQLEEIPLGVDSTRFAPLVNEQVPLFKDYEILKLLFVGALDRAHHFKGVDILLQAIARLKRKVTSLPGPPELRRLNLHLSIVGRGELIEYYDYLVNHLKIEENVEFLGFVRDEDLSAIYQSADVLIFPSVGRAEAFGLVALEGMSSGLPVIASKLPGVQTLFADDQLLVKPGSVKELADKIELLLKNKALIKKIGRQNRQRVLEYFTWTKAVDKLEAVYQRLL